MGEEFNKWIALWFGVRLVLVFVQLRQLELLSDIAGQMENSLRAIDVVI